MVTQLKDFTAKLEQFSYMKYALYRTEAMLVITLYNTDDLERFVIIGSLSGEDAGLIAYLEHYRQA
jgi:hypothetical protein